MNATIPEEPSSYKLGAHRIKIKEDPEIDIFLEAISARGAYSREQNEIRIASGMSGSYRDFLLWHEIVHSIMGHYGKEELDKDENLIDCLAEGILQVIKTIK